MIGCVNAVSSLTNLRLGPEGYKVKLTTTLDKPVRAAGLWFYNIWSDNKEGYSSGTGGEIRLTIFQKGLTKFQGYYKPKASTFLLNMMFQGSLTLGGEVTIYWENVDDDPGTNWASLNAMKLVGKIGDGERDKLDVLWTGKDTSWSERSGELTFSMTDRKLIWDFVDDKRTNLDVGYNYYEVWSKVPVFLGKVRQNTPNGVDLEAVSKIRLYLPINYGNVVCLVKTVRGQFVGVDVGDDRSGGFVGWKTFRFFRPICGSEIQSVEFVCDELRDGINTQIWPIRKAVLPFGHAEINRDGTWQGWSYWGIDDRKLATLPINFE